jgi:glutaredoxin 3
MSAQSFTRAAAAVKSATLVRMPKVTIYTLRGCVHCFRARRRLRRKGVEFEEIKTVSAVASARADLRSRFGAGTFPQIVIGDRHIGGADQLLALDKSGELDALLAGDPPP